MAVKELTEGNPIKLITIFMLPIFLGNIFQQFYTLVDALIVGRVLGIDALAAVGATNVLVFLIISFVFAATQGFTVVTAQKFGAQQYDLVRKSLAASLILSAVLTFILTIISTPFAYQLLALLRTPDNIINMSSTYLTILFAGIFATVFYNLSSNVVRALGDSKTPLYFLIFSCIVNIFFDLLLIIKFKMGIGGAAWATVISQAISTVCCVSYMFYKFPILRLKKDDWKVSKEFLYEHLRIGIPMGFQMSVLIIGLLAMQYVLNSFGSKAIAAFTTAVRVEQVFTQTYLALAAAMAVYTAQNFGAGKMVRIKDGAKSAGVIIALITFVSVTAITLFSKPMISAFMTEVDSEVLAMGQQYLHISIMFYIFFGVLVVFRNMLQGMGNVGIPVVSGFVELIARGGAAIIFGYYFGYVGVCYSTPAAWLCGSLYIFVSYKFSLLKNAKKLHAKSLRNKSCN